MAGADEILLGRQWTVVAGDSLEMMGWLPDDSVDSIVCDPPSGISFMGKAWDSDKGGRRQWIAWLADIMREALRILKPGGYALVWALPRTSHWTGTAIEDAGFEVRDCIQHMFGSGFPKALRSDKAIDAHFGHDVSEPYEPISDEAKEWTGWKLALKPSAEFWWVARKPLIGTVAANVLEHGTGALNIDGCRAGTEVLPEQKAGKAVIGTFEREDMITPERTGRWPPHTVFTHADDCGAECVEGCPVLELGRQSGAAGASAPVTGREPSAAVEPGTVTGERARVPGAFHDDEGTAARFFPQFRYVAKPSRAEKDAGVTRESMTSGEATGRKDGSAGTKNPRAGAGRTGGARNPHPTAKSIDLMRWLVRLITPPAGVVLDMFNGSGTTGCAAVLERFRYIGIDLDPVNVEVSDERIAFWAEVDPNYDVIPKPKPKTEGESRQVDILDLLGGANE